VHPAFDELCEGALLAALWYACSRRSSTTVRGGTEGSSGTYAQWQRGDEKQEGVRLQTVHKSQGREFKAVALVGLNEGQFPDFRARTTQERRSELRAFYVAAARASRCLLLSRPALTMSRNGPWKRAESPFLRILAEV
jgi:superfamily I DNA/RNA helicase